ncbi:MAG: corrinoid protein [Actinobacteria bacterium]|nr:corrinoid protein [Actinomycetota bacterium]
MSKIILNEIYNSMLEGDDEQVELLVKSSLNQGIDPSEILKTLTDSLNEIGKLFEKKELYLPDLMIAGKTMEKSLLYINPYLKNVGYKREMLATIIIGTVKGDLHTIGKSIVSTMLRTAGFEVIDIGEDISPEQFLEAIKKYQPDILAMSSLLSTTAIEQKKVTDMLVELNIREKILVIVGGGAIDEDFAKEIGADGYAPSAVSAVTMLKSLLKP